MALKFFQHREMGQWPHREHMPDIAVTPEAVVPDVVPKGPKWVPTPPLLALSLPHSSQT